MSTTAVTFTNLGSSTTQNYARRVIRYPDLFDRIMRELLRDESYEEDEHYARPGAVAAIRASAFLGDTLPAADLNYIEVEPYLGEINITWRSRQRGRHVKAIFTRNGALSLYHEQMQHGRVVNRNIIANAGNDALRHWVNWVYHGQ